MSMANTADLEPLSGTIHNHFINNMIFTHTISKHVSLFPFLVHIVYWKENIT